MKNNIDFFKFFIVISFVLFHCILFFRLYFPYVTMVRLNPLEVHHLVITSLISLAVPFLSGSMLFHHLDDNQDRYLNESYFAIFQKFKMLPLLEIVKHILIGEWFNAFKWDSLWLIGIMCLIIIFSFKLLKNLYAILFTLPLFFILFYLNEKQQLGMHIHLDYLEQFCTFLFFYYCLYTFLTILSQKSRENLLSIMLLPILFIVLLYFTKGAAFKPKEYLHNIVWGDDQTLFIWTIFPWGIAFLLGYAKEWLETKSRLLYWPLIGLSSLIVIHFFITEYPILFAYKVHNYFDMNLRIFYPNFNYFIFYLAFHHLIIEVTIKLSAKFKLNKNSIVQLFSKEMLTIYSTQMVFIYLLLKIAKYLSIFKFPQLTFILLFLINLYFSYKISKISCWLKQKIIRIKFKRIRT